MTSGAATAAANPHKHICSAGALTLAA